MKQYDLVVLGTGGAGYQVAIKCREAGWKVAAVDRGPFGGTCSVRGCIPKKVLAGIAEIADMNRRLHSLGITSREPQFDWGATIKLKRTFTDSVPQSTVDGLKAAGVDVYKGSPRFISPTTLEVNSEMLGAKKVHIAVGLEPVTLPIEGAEHIINSDAFMELHSLPKRVLFVGAGYVSFEFAHVAARFGAKAVMLQSDDKPLPMFDPDVVQTLRDATQDIGIKLVLNVPAEKIEKHGAHFVVKAAGKVYETDLVVHGAGRIPAVRDMNLEAANIDYDKRRGIKVNDYLQSTSNPNVYAAGDVADAGLPLSPVSSRQGAVVAGNLLGKKRRQPDYLSTPSVVFTTPAVAKVGYLESEAKDKKLEFDVITNDLGTWFDNKRLGLKHAMSKVLVEKSGKILGAHIIGNHAEDLVNMFSLAIEQGLTVEQLKAPIFAFPTATNDMRSMF